MSNKFELHIGFPNAAESEAMNFWGLLQREERRKGWSYSEVGNVFTNPNLKDPHNVPGTLRYLMSQNFSGRDDLQEGDVLSEAQWVLSNLAAMGIEDARLEIEFVYGYLTRRQDSEHGEASLHFLEPPDWDKSKLELRDGSLIETPNSEIHFIVEQNYTAGDPAQVTPTISGEEASQILRAYGVSVQQTIEYRSQKMVEAGSEDKKLICTAYYGNPSVAEREARRLFIKSNLCEALAAKGYSLKLVLERILGCYMPSRKSAAHVESHDAEESGMVRA